MANKKGHWYTDKNGNHYFVEEGQSPQEGWEASKRRKMIDGGKYKVSEDGSEYTDVTEDEYNKYEADETDFDETNEDDFGFDEEGNDDFYSPDNITKRHQKIEDAFEMPKEEGWEPSDFGEKSFIKNKDKDNEMFIQYNGADYDGNNQEWVAGYMKDGEYVNKKFASMEEAKEFLDNADQVEDTKIVSMAGQPVDNGSQSNLKVVRTESNRFAVLDTKSGTYKSDEFGDIQSAKNALERLNKSNLNTINFSNRQRMATYTAEDETGISEYKTKADVEKVANWLTENGYAKDTSEAIDLIKSEMQHPEDIDKALENAYQSKYKSEDYEDARYYPVSDEDRKAAGPKYLGRYHSIFDAAGLDDNEPGSWKKSNEMFKYVGDSDTGASIVQGPDGYFSGNPRINSMSFKTFEQAKDYLDRKNPEEHKYGVYFKPGDEREYMYRDAEDKYDLEAPDAYRNAREAEKSDRIGNRKGKVGDRELSLNELIEKTNKLDDRELARDIIAIQAPKFNLSEKEILEYYDKVGKK